MKRVLSGIIIFFLTLLIFILGNNLICNFFVMVVCMISIQELLNAFKIKQYNPISIIPYLFCLIFLLNTKISIIFSNLFIPLLFTLCFLIYFIDYDNKRNRKLMDIIITIFITIYIVYFLHHISKVLFLKNGKFYIWYIFITSWITDVFALLIGKTIGKHHFTKLSPNKTIEGSIGGIICGSLASVIYTIILNKFLGLNISIFIISLISILLCILGQIGDLLASSIKRFVKIKDFSNLIPGHGGMLDRIDSIILIAPIAYIILTLYN